MASDTAPYGPDATGSITANFSLIQNTSGDTLINPSANDITGQSAVMAPLGNFGGKIQTMPLLPGSPAIDAGSNAPVPTGRDNRRAGCLA